jgi:hypothetical protein
VDACVEGRASFVEQVAERDFSVCQARLLA